MSAKSARRLLFSLANSPHPWGAMATLTYRWCPLRPKEDLREWMRDRRIAPTLTGQYAWIMEFQARGVVHFHFLWGRDVLESQGYDAPGFRQQIARNGKPTTLLRGPFDTRVSGAWIDSVRDNSPEFLAFQSGGIVEILGSDDSAARYFSNYCAKKEQKELPKGIKAGGRWWYVSEAATPKATATATLTSWPFLWPYGMVFAKKELDGHLADIVPTGDTLLGTVQERIAALDATRVKEAA